MRSLIHPSCSNVRSNGCSYEWFDTGMHPPTLCEGEGHLTKVFCIAEHRKISFSMVQPYIFVAFHQCPNSIASCSSFEGQLVNKALPKNRIDPTVLLPMDTDGVKCWLILSPVISIHCFFLYVFIFWGDNLVLRSYFSGGLKTPTRFLATCHCHCNVFWIAE